LHGTVQTRLISCAVAIEQASRSGDVDQFRRALETSIAILDAPFPDATDDFSATLAEQVKRMCAPWQGLCHFVTEVDPEAARLRGPVAMAAGRIIEEAVGNACRHGLADTISIRVTRVEGPSLHFEIDDDGSGPGGGPAGLGTVMLAGLSNGQVFLTPRSEGGSRLTVMLPID
jgi:signal transduction histidine kinase